MFFACFPKILKFQSAVFPNNLKVYTLKIHPGGPTVPSGPSAEPMGMKNRRKRGYRPCNRTYGQTRAVSGDLFDFRLRDEKLYSCSSRSS